MRAPGLSFSSLCRLELETQNDAPTQCRQRSGGTQKAMQWSKLSPNRREHPFSEEGVHLEFRPGSRGASKEGTAAS